jgi:hypothetical protein
VGGRARRLARGLGRRAGSLLKAHPGVRAADWLCDLQFGGIN